MPSVLRALLELRHEVLHALFVRSRHLLGGHGRVTDARALAAGARGGVADMQHADHPQIAVSRDRAQRVVRAGLERVDRKGGGSAGIDRRGLERLGADHHTEGMGRFALVPDLERDGHARRGLDHGGLDRELRQRHGHLRRLPGRSVPLDRRLRRSSVRRARHDRGHEHEGGEHGGAMNRPADPSHV